MSISTEINRIKNNIESAYTQIENKGGTIPSTKNSANLATAISSIVAGGGLPSGISKIAFGEYTVTSAFTTTRQTVTHNLGTTPDMVIFYYDNGNIATTYSMLFAIRSSKLGYRSSAYNSYYAYHGNSTTTVTMANSNNANYGVGNLTNTTFTIQSHSTSYYWRANTYKWIAIKFA